MSWKRSLPCPQCGEEVDLAILERLRFFWPRLRSRFLPSCPSCGEHLVYPLSAHLAGAVAGLLAVLVPLGLLHSAGWWSLSTPRGCMGAGLLFPVFFALHLGVVSVVRRTLATRLESF